MKLSVLLSEIKDLKINNFKEREITLVTADSRCVKEGAIFVCIKGKQRSGYDFIHDAYVRGARVFVGEHFVELPRYSTVITVENAKKCMAEMVAVFYQHPERKMKIIGVTGTKGKTTATYYLHKMLTKSGVKNILVGTLGIMNEECGEYIKTANTTPGAELVYKALHAAYCKGVDTAVFEVSSQALKEMRVFGLPFFAVGFTSLGTDHIGTLEHASRADYLSAKRSLFTSYGARYAAVNYDDPYSSYMSSGIESVSRCGTARGADLRISGYREHPEGCSFYLSKREVSLSTPGLYNARNAAVALSLATTACGAPLFELSGALANISVPGRFERHTVRGRNVIIDYAHNAESFTEALTLARRIYNGKIIAVFGSVGDRTELRRRAMAQAAEKLADFSVITADDSAHESLDKVMLEIYSAYRDKRRAVIIPDREDAIRRAVIGFAKEGDAVLLLGKGHEEQIVTPTGARYFSERKILRELGEAVM